MILSFIIEVFKKPEGCNIILIYLLRISINDEYKTFDINEILDDLHEYIIKNPILYSIAYLFINLFINFIAYLFPLLLVWDSRSLKFQLINIFYKYKLKIFLVLYIFIFN